MVQPFTTLVSVAVPLLRDNIDTDAIIPSREIKTVSKVGLADGLFAGWRYRRIGGRETEPAFVLNDPIYAGAEILLAGENFGCGSSREHAVWALAEYGFRAILAPSFSPIFQANCVRNGLAPVELPAVAISHLAADLAPAPQQRPVTVDLTRCVVVGPDGSATDFEMDAEAREMLLEGIDPIGLTMKRAAEIQDFKNRDRQLRPWAYL
jgi:3-isopropylmalate/(R)-2-methylmalate dehydratase small subunit